MGTIARLPNGDLIAAGHFTSAGGVSVRNIARWDGERWHPLGEGLDREVLSLLVLDNGDLIAGGWFKFSGDLAVNHIARWDGQAWHRIGRGLDDRVIGLARDGSGAIVASTWSHNAIVQWTGTDWRHLEGADGWRMPVDSSVTTLPSGHIFAAGTLPNGQYVSRVWHDENWHEFGFNGPGPLAFRPDGRFYFLAHDGLGFWDRGGTLIPLGEGLYGGSGRLAALHVHSNGDLIAGGAFDAAGERRANNIARWDGSSWHSMDGGVTGVFPRVHSLVELPNGDVVVVGWFQKAGGVEVNNIARWDGKRWHPF